MKRPSALLQMGRGEIWFAKSNGASLQPNQHIHSPNPEPFWQILTAIHSCSASRLSAVDAFAPASSPVSLHCLLRVMRLSRSCTMKSAGTLG